MVKGRPQPIGEILGELVSRRGFARVQVTDQFTVAWREVAGEFLAGQTRVGGLKRGVLEVIVAHSTLMQELTFQKTQLQKELSRRLPDERITGLRFKVGAISS